MGGWIQNMFDNGLSTSHPPSVLYKLRTTHHYSVCHMKREIYRSHNLFTLRDYTDSHNYGYTYYSVYSRCQTSTTIKFQIAIRVRYRNSLLPNYTIQKTPPCVRLP